MIEMIIINPLVNLLQLGIFHLDDLLFGRKDVKYAPAQNMLLLPYWGALICSVWFFIMAFFTNLEEQAVMNMMFRLLIVFCGGNILLYCFKILQMRSVIKQFFYFIFVSVISFGFGLIVFVIALYAILIVMLILIAVILLAMFADSGTAPSVLSSGDSGSSSGSFGGSDFVRKDQKEYLLDDGSTVAWDAMTGNYVSTNPLFPAEYEKQGDSFVQVG